MAEEFDFTLQSGRVHAQRFGAADAPLVLAVHGLSANMHGFDYIAPELVADGSRQVVAVDLRGRGGSDPAAPGTYGLAAHASDMLEVATLLGQDRFDWVGWSLGAMIGILAAGLQPGRIRHLGLIDHAGGRSDRSAVAAVVTGLDRLDLDSTTAEDYVRRVEALSSIRPFNDFWRCFYGYEFRRTHKSACLADAQDVSEQDWPQLWRRLSMPVLLLRCCQPFHGGLLVPDDVVASISSVVPTLSIVDVDADHFSVMTQEATVRALRALLDQP